jgi:tetratricopeptide (TPR) repeat protein
MRTSKSRFANATWLLAGCGLLLVAGCQQPAHQERQAKAQAHWNQVRAGIKVQLARQTFERGQIAEALRIVEEALAADPDNVAGRVVLAQCRLEQGQVAAAQRAMDQAAAIEVTGPARAELEFVRGQIAEARGEHNEALQAYEQARLLDDTRPVYLTSAAQCLMNLRRPQDALALLQENAVDYGKNPTIYAMIGQIALSTGDKTLAEQAFRQVLSTGEFNPVIAEEYALLAADQGRYEEVLSVLAPLKAAAGDLSPSATLAAARAMLAMGQTEPAKRELTRLLQRNVDDLAAWYLLGHAGILSDDLPTMVRSAAEAKRLAPEAQQTLLLESYAMLKEGRAVEAQAVLQRLRDLDNDDSLVHCMLGWAAIRRNDVPAARQHFRRALEVDPACAWARTELSRLESGLVPTG